MTIDEGGYFGSAANAFTNDPLTYGSDFALLIDQEDGTSRSGILVRINNLWPKPQVRQTGMLSPFVGESFGNVKVVYTAGYTTGTLPSSIRLACNLLVMKLNTVMPLGAETQSEGYEERSLSVVTSERQRLMAYAAPLLENFKNRKW